MYLLFLDFAQFYIFILTGLSVYKFITFRTLSGIAEYLNYLLN